MNSAIDDDIPFEISSQAVETRQSKLEKFNCRRFYETISPYPWQRDLRLRIKVGAETCWIDESNRWVRKGTSTDQIGLRKGYYSGAPTGCDESDTWSSSDEQSSPSSLSNSGCFPSGRGRDFCLEGMEAIARARSALIWLASDISTHCLLQMP